MSYDSLVNNPLLKAYWICGLCVFEEPTYSFIMKRLWANGLCNIMPSDEDFVSGEIGESSDQLSESESDS